MSLPQQIPPHSEASQTSPDTGIERIVPSANTPREKPPKPFSSNSRFHGDLMEILRRFLLASLSLVLLIMALWGFSTLQRLDKWEQHFINTVSLLLTAMASLGLGSLLGYLGSMLRWPLLALTRHKMQDVDSILGMTPPTRSLRLIKRHIQEQRISRTTMIVAIYLVTNILGRSSVAIFGLAFSLKDEKGITYPILATNWASALWTRNINPSTDGPDIPKNHEIVEDFLSSVWNGLREHTQILGPAWAYGNNQNYEFGDNSSYLLSDLKVSNTTIKVGTDIVEYWYELKDFKEDVIRPTNHTAHSAVNCSLIEVEEGQYWRWNTWNRTGPFNWGEENSNQVVSRALWVSNYSTTNIEYPHWASFGDSTNGSHAPSQIYILCGHFAWECFPALTETVTSNPQQLIQPHERLFHPTSLYGLLGMTGEGYSYGTDKDITLSLDGISHSPAQAAIDSLDIICNQRFAPPLNVTVWNGYRLWVSGVVARLPILAIMHANTVLPRIARGPHPNQTAGTAYTYKSLEVNWLRILLIAGSIMIGQILAILAVLYYCNGIYTRDDSYLATAELLKTVINRVDGGKLMTGEELAASLDFVLGVPVSYGTKVGQGSGPPEVDLASSLDPNFPPFPPGQRFWMYIC